MTQDRGNDVAAIATGIVLAAAAGTFGVADYLLGQLEPGDYPAALRHVVLMITGIMKGAGLTEDDLKTFFTAAAFTVALGDGESGQ